MSARSGGVLVAAAAVAIFLGGCGVGVQPLMPTPVIYTEADFSPLDHIPEEERWNPRRVYYVTNRERDKNLQRIDYGNTMAKHVSLGLAVIGFGGPTMTWADLSAASSSADRDDMVPLSIAGIIEAGQVALDATPEEASKPNAAGFILEDMNDAIDDARDKDVLIYVHGAKVNFYNACVFAAMLDHFMGRDMTSIAFSWPTRQDIFAYAFGSDIKRGYDSAEVLASMIEVLASETHARRIHVLSWSAGGRVATKALASLRRRHPDEDPETLRQRFRIGTAYFAAGDVPIDEFLEAVEDIHGISDSVVVTASSYDEALKVGKTIMGGQRRIGQKGKPGEQVVSEEQKQMLLSLDRLEIVDVSRGAENRGFDITGHQYWFNHPWASTDVLMAIRTDFPPPMRGLEQDTEYPILWYIPEDYPQRLKRQLKESEVHRWDLRDPP